MVTLNGQEVSLFTGVLVMLAIFGPWFVGWVVIAGKAADLVTRVFKTIAKVPSDD